MSFDLNTCFQGSKCGFPKTLLKPHFLREGSILIPIKFNFTENFRLIFFSLLMWTIELGVGGVTAVLARSVDSLPEVLSEKSLTGERTKILSCSANRRLPDSKVIASAKGKSLAISGDSCNESLESFSVVSPLVSRSLLAPHQYLAESDFILANEILSNASFAQQNSIGIATKELTLSVQPQIFSPLSPIVIPVAVSLWATNLSLSNTGIAIDPIEPDSTRDINLPKTSENLPSLIPIDLLSQVQRTDQKQTQPQQSNPSSSPDGNSPSPSAEEESESPDAEVDPDLGRLRLRERKVPPRQPQPILHVIPRISYFYTNNVFSGVDPVEDSLYFPSLTLWSTPKLGPSTYLTMSVDGSLIRYLNESQFDYNLLRFRTGIYQRFNSRMGGEIGWNNQQYFRASNGDRFLDEHFIYLTLSRRDWLNRKLALDSFYDVRLSFANPDNRSRLINYLSMSLSYYLQRNLQVGMDYQFSFSDFTKREREDYYHRLLGRLSYGLSQDSQINLQGGVTIGGSNDPNIDFDSLFFSVTYSLDLKVF